MCMATASQWAHAVVACVLVAMAVLLPVVFMVVTLVVPEVRQRRARRRLLERRERDEDAVVAAPHSCGGFRLAVARNDITEVKALTYQWKEMGMVRQRERHCVSDTWAARTRHSLYKDCV